MTTSSFNFLGKAAKPVCITYVFFLTKRDLEIRPLDLPPEPPADTPSLTPPPAEQQVQGGDTVDIIGFRFTGNSAFSDEQLAAVLLDLSGQALTLSQLQQAADRITAWYRQHEWLLARAILPPQEIDDGYLLIQVVEGNYDQVDLSNQSTLPDRLMINATRRLNSGDGVRAGTLENALMNLSLIQISDPTTPNQISNAVLCMKTNNKKKKSIYHITIRFSCSKYSVLDNILI